MRQRSPGRNALFFILITILIDALGLGIIIPVLPELIMELTGETLSEAAFYGGMLLFAYAFMQFLCAPILGNLSDCYGRRPVLLVSLTALGLDYFLMGMAPSITLLFIGRILAGLFGATAATANTYIADITAENKRAQTFGLLGAAWGVGFTLGPVLGGFLGEISHRLPFFIAGIMAFINVIYGYFVLPETLPIDKRRPFTLKRANTFSALLSMRRYPLVFGLFAVLFCYQIAHDANPAIWTYYTMLKFGWSEREVGYSMAFIGICVMIVMGGLTRIMIPKIGEKRAVYIGLLIAASGFTGFAFASSSAMMIAFIVPFSLMGLTIPALRAIMSNEVAANEQGALQGAITSIISLTAIIAPIVMTGLFRFFTREGTAFYFPGAPFLTAAFIMIIGIVIFVILMPRIPHTSR